MRRGWELEHSNPAVEAALKVSEQGNRNQRILDLLLLISL